MDTQPISNKGTPKIAVVGHVEWTRLARVDRVPAAGEIAHASSVWEGPAGGGAVAAVQIARLAGACTFFTALGADDAGRRARGELEVLGVEVRTATRAARTREAVALIDDTGERTLTTLGDRLAPQGSDPLGWNDLHAFDAVYYTAGDTAALHGARRARVLVASLRELRALAAARIPADALVGSSRDAAERYEEGVLAQPPGLLVLTAGECGGTFVPAGQAAATYAAEHPPGPVVDTCGTGDSFAGALTYALAILAEIEHALALAARCGAAVLTGPGPLTGQLTTADLTAATTGPAPPGRGTVERTITHPAGAINAVGVDR